MKLTVLTASLAMMAAATAAQADCIIAPGNAGCILPAGGVTTTGFANGNYFTSTSGVPLNGGSGFTLATSGTLLASGTGWAPFTDGYTGDLIDTSSTSETLFFSTALAAFTMEVSPDVGLALPGFQGNAQFTVLLSNGLNFTTSAANFTAGDSDVLGFSGLGDISWIEVTVSGTNGFGSAISDFAFGDFTAVPEPSSLAMFGVGLAGLVVAARRRRV